MDKPCDEDPAAVWLESHLLGSILLSTTCQGSKIEALKGQTGPSGKSASKVKLSELYGKPSGRWLDAAVAGALTHLAGREVEPEYSDQGLLRSTGAAGVRLLVNA